MRASMRSSSSPRPLRAHPDLPQEPAGQDDAANIHAGLEALREDGQRRDAALGELLQRLTEQSGMLRALQDRISDSSFKGGGGGSGGGSAASPARAASGPSPTRFDEQYEIPTCVHGHEPAQRGPPSTPAVDSELYLLLQSDRGLQQTLQKLKQGRLNSEKSPGSGRVGPVKGGPVAHGAHTRPILSISPDSRFRSAWNVVLAILLVFTCVQVPLRLAFPPMFESSPGVAHGAWVAFELVVEWYFVCGVLLNFFTGFRNREGVVVYRLDAIARR
jgi:hypothetical protein